MTNAFNEDAPSKGHSNVNNIVDKGNITMLVKKVKSASPCFTNASTQMLYKLLMQKTEVAQ
jgi:hypothetical protein